MKVAYFEPNWKKHQPIIPGKAAASIINAPTNVEDYQFKCILNFAPNLKDLKAAGFHVWTKFSQKKIGKYLAGGKKGIRSVNQPNSKNSVIASIQQAMAARINVLASFKSGKGTQTYYKLKYEAFVQGYLYYYEKYNSSWEDDSRIVYFDWGILNSKAGLTIFLNPMHGKKAFPLKSKSNTGPSQGMSTAAAPSETDPQQPPPPPPPTRDDSV